MNVKNKVTKVNEKQIFWTDKINSILVSRRVKERHCLSVKSEENLSIIYLMHPSPWFDIHGKCQRKFMQMHLSLVKNCETMNACFNHQLDGIELCYYFGSLCRMKLREAMLSRI